jgi:hypothetical protein
MGGGQLVFDAKLMELIGYSTLNRYFERHCLAMFVPDDLKTA